MKESLTLNKMKKIILISCVSKKLSKKSKAESLYISPLFKFNLKFAKQMNPDKIFILSAEHHLLPLDKEIEPYNKTLNTMKSDEIKEWAGIVLNQLRKEANLNQDKFIFLAGERYRKFLVPHINNYEIPLKGLGIGKQLGWLKKKVSDVQRML